MALRVHLRGHAAASKNVKMASHVLNHWWVDCAWKTVSWRKVWEQQIASQCKSHWFLVLGMGVTILMNPWEHQSQAMQVKLPLEGIPTFHWIASSDWPWKWNRFAQLFCLPWPRWPRCCKIHLHSKLLKFAKNCQFQTVLHSHEAGYCAHGSEY